MEKGNQHFGPLGAPNDISVSEGTVEASPEYFPPDHQDPLINVVVDLNAQQIRSEGRAVAGSKQYQVGIHNKEGQ